MKIKIAFEKSRTAGGTLATIGWTGREEKNDYFRTYHIPDAEYREALLKEFANIINNEPTATVEILEPMVWDFSTSQQYTLAVMFYREHRPQGIDLGYVHTANFIANMELIRNSGVSGDYVTLNNGIVREVTEARPVVWHDFDTSDVEARQNKDGVLEIKTTKAESKVKEVNW